MGKCFEKISKTHNSEVTLKKSKIIILKNYLNAGSN